MRKLTICLALVGTLSAAACQNNMATPSSTVETGETPSNGLVPGQTPE